MAPALAKDAEVTGDPRDSIDPALELGHVPGIRAVFVIEGPTAHEHLAADAEVRFDPDLPLTFEGRPIGRILEARPLDGRLELVVEIDREHAGLVGAVGLGFIEDTSLGEVPE